MEMIVDDVKCKQLFEYNDDNYITSIKIMADRECRVVFKNMTNNKYEIKKIGINISNNYNLLLFLCVFCLFAVKNALGNLKFSLRLFLNINHNLKIY